MFFLPLLLAGLHLCFAFPFVHKLLMLFNLNNVKLLIGTTALSYVVFEVTPTDDDMLALEKSVAEVGAQFAATEELKSFVRANRNGKIADTYVSAAQLSPFGSALPETFAFDLPAVSLPRFARAKPG